MAFKIMSLSALALTIAMAQAPMAIACSGKHKEDWILKVTEKLDLSTEQKVKIKSYAHKAKLELESKHHELKEIHTHVNEAFHSGNINEAKVDEFANQEEKVMGSIARIRLHERFEVYNTLNEKQKEKMGKMIKDWEEKHHKN